MVNLGDLTHLEERFRSIPRSMGHYAMTQGVGTEVLLGMLDDGMPLGDVVEALVMHGELPSVDERPEERDTEILLIEDDGDWRVAT